MSKIETTLQSSESLELDFLIGHKIVSVTGFEDEIITLDNGKVYKITSNEGCGGCSNGWSEVTGLDELPTDNMITDVKYVDGKDPEDDNYTIFVYFHDKKFEVEADDGWGNGYYGGGFTVTVAEVEED